MKRSGKRMLALLASAILTLNPVVNALASNTFDASWETVSDSVLFPGDSVTGIAPVYLAPDMIELDSSGYWTNNADEAYLMSGYDDGQGGGGLLLTSLGYALTVKGGTSKNEFDPSVKHYTPKDEMELETMKDTDIAAYPMDTEVTITAGPVPEGMVFDHWEVEPSEIGLTDAYAQETKLWMPDKKVTVTAIFNAVAEQQATEMQVDPGWDDGSQGWDDGSQGWDDGSQGWDDGSQGWDDGSQGWDDGSQGWDDGSQGWDDGSQGSDNGSQGWDDGSQGWNDGNNSGQDVTWDSGWENGSDNAGGADNGVVEVVVPETPAAAKYTITAINAAVDGIDPVYDNVYEFEEGAYVPVIAQVPEGMEFSGWTVSPDYLQLADASAPATNFYMPAENVTLTANFALPQPTTYPVTVINGEGSTQAAEGAEVTVFCNAPAEGWKFTGWTAAGLEIYPDLDLTQSVLTFMMPAQEVTLTANYEMLPTLYTVTAVNATVGAEGAETAQYEAGQSVAVTAWTPAEGMQFAGWSAEGVELEDYSSSTVYFNMPAGNVTLTANFEPIPPTLYTVTAVNASVGPDGADTAQYEAGQTVTVTAWAPAEGMQFAGWSADGVELEDYSASTVNFTMPAANVILTAGYVPIPPTLYTVTAVNATVGEEGAETAQYEAGQSVTVTARTPAEGMQFAGWSAEGVELEDYSSSTVYFNMPAGNVTLTANFEPIPPTLYTVTAVNASVGPDGADTAQYEAGQSVTVTAWAPAEGMQFAGWSADGVELEDYSAATVNFTMPAGNVILTAGYEAVPTEVPQTEVPQTEVPQTEAPQTETTPVVETEISTEASSPAGGEIQPGQTEETGIETEAPSTDAPETDAPSTDAPETDEPETDTPSTDAPETDEPETDEPETDEPETDVPETDAPETEEPVTEGPVLYNVIVGGVSENQNQQAAAGEIIEVHADEPDDGMYFAGWTEEGITLEDPEALEITFTMPENDVMLSAEYGEEEPEEFTVTINNSSGSTTARAGEELIVTADEPEEGKEFAGWEAEGVDLINPESQVISFVMPENNVTLTATYKEVEEKKEEEVTHVLTVIGAQGSNDAAVTGKTYTVGVGSGDVPAGQVFDHWEAEGLVLTDTQKKTTSFTFEMPDADVTLTACYVNEEDKLYTVTIVNGTVNGDTIVDVKAGTQLTAVANAPADGKEFDRWTAYNVGLTNPLLEAVTFTVPEKNVTLVAQYKDTADPLYTITYGSDVSISGNTTRNGAAVAHAGDYIIMKTTEVSGYDFTGWNVTRNDNGAKVADVTLSDYLTAGFIMPDANVTIRTVRERIATNQVVVLSGSGSGIYQVGTWVTITANPAPAGYRFKQWNVVSANVNLDNRYATTTGFTMPNQSVRISAEYEPVYYTLTVNSGTGSAVHLRAGDKVSIAAYMPAEGKEFAGWYVTTRNASVANPGRFYTSIVMPAADVVVQATYKDAHSSYYNYIGGIEQGGYYLRGSQITFYGSGNGMDNEWPNPGDIRWEPTGYQIGSVTGSWATGSSYSTTMSVNANGDYTLYVTFLREKYDGNYWVNTGVTDTKSVSFHVTDNIAAQTGDPTDFTKDILIPAILGSAAGLAAIAAAVILIIRRKKRR